MALAFTTPATHASAELDLLEEFLWPEVQADLPTRPLSNAIRKGASQALKKRVANTYWNLPAYLGTHYISQYYLLLQYLGTHSTLFSTTKLEPKVLRKILLSSQRSDGSWISIEDKNTKEADLNATVLNYWALKAMGEPLTQPVMNRAKAFILEKGGLSSCTLFTKVFLALFGNYSWDQIPSIPKFLFDPLSPLHESQFAQWIGPHLLPMSYLRSLKVAKDLGPRFSLDELSPFQNARTPKSFIWNKPDRLDQNLIELMISRQQPHGSFGGYTISTLLTLIAIDHLNQTTTTAHQLATQRGFHFIEERYFKSDASNYLGVLDDGRYWDTALIGLALLEAGLPVNRLEGTADFLTQAQTPHGGFPFGLDFSYAPDTDDTAEILLFLKQFPDHSPEAKKALHWLISMQNKDGGWGAFDQNNTGNFLLRFFTAAFTDSADLFDESSADVTGHILEAFAAYGFTRFNSETVEHAIEYLQNTQDAETGTWEGRWGINRLYGTSSALVGLLKVGVEPKEKWIQHSINWLKAHQNEDGGFGETAQSYASPSLWGKGISTPTQTAWVLLALIEAHATDLTDAKEAARAAQYLIQFINRHGQWFDPSTVGTGHPGIISMNYPSYPVAFPLTALARYKKALGN